MTARNDADLTQRNSSPRDNSKQYGTTERYDTAPELYATERDTTTTPTDRYEPTRFQTRRDATDQTELNAAPRYATPRPNGPSRLPIVTKQYATGQYRPIQTRRYQTRRDCTDPSGLLATQRYAAGRTEHYRTDPTLRSTTVLDYTPRPNGIIATDATMHYATDRTQPYARLETIRFNTSRDRPDESGHCHPSRYPTAPTSLDKCNCTAYL